MPKPFKLHSTRPLPPDAEIVEHEGKPHVRLKERGRAVLYPLTRDGSKYLRPSKCWYFKIRDANGTIKRAKGFADLKATETLAGEMERRASRVRSGFTDPAEEHARRPLAEHLDDYSGAMKAKGSTGAHVCQSVARVRALLDGAGFAFLRDVDAARAAEWLNSIRRDDAAVELPPGVDAFRPSEAAKLLGITTDALAKHVRRHQLAATGDGKARRLPRATVQYLADRAARGTGPETANHYVRAVRGFFRWLVRSKRIGANPLESLPLLNSAVDVRRLRRELTADELRQLFDAARGSNRTFRGLTGPDRFALYLMAAGTGFRASALAGLTPSDFDLDAGTATLAARLNKSRRLKVQPLPPDVAESLRGYLAGKPANRPIWGREWLPNAAAMLRIDLDAAGIAYAVEGPEGPEYADFHSLRHSFLTLGGRSGIDLRTLQELAGHSSPTLTARYSHRRLYDLAGAVEKLPNLVPAPTPTVAELPNRRIETYLSRAREQIATPAVAELPLRLTGTEGAAGVPPGVPPGVPTGYAGRHSSARISTNGTIGRMSDDATQAHEMQEPAPNGAGSHQFARVKALGLEPRTNGLKVPSSGDVSYIPANTLSQSADPGRTTGRTSMTSEGGISDPDLAALVAAWPTLTARIRAAVLALVGTVNSNKE